MRRLRGRGLLKSKWNDKKGGYQMWHPKVKRWVGKKVYIPFSLYDHNGNKKKIRFW